MGVIGDDDDDVRWEFNLSLLLSQLYFTQLNQLFIHIDLYHDYHSPSEYYILLFKIGSDAFAPFNGL